MYQMPVPGVTAFCACNMQALARCTDCAADLCLDHRLVWHGQVFCHNHFRTRSVAAQQAETAALEKDAQRLQGLLLAVPERLAHGVPHFWFGHELRPKEYSGMGLEWLKTGDPCPVHGAPACAVDRIARTGRLNLRLGAVHLKTKAWVLMEDAWTRDRLNDLGPYERRSDTRMSHDGQYIAVTALGTLVKFRAHHWPLGIAPVEGHFRPLRPDEIVDSISLLTDGSTGRLHVPGEMADRLEALLLV